MSAPIEVRQKAPGSMHLAFRITAGMPGGRRFSLQTGRCMARFAGETRLPGTGCPGRPGAGESGRIKTPRRSSVQQDGVSDFSGSRSVFVFPHCKAQTNVPGGAVPPLTSLLRVDRALRARFDSVPALPPGRAMRKMAVVNSPATHHQDQTVWF